jgi:hypothetical protein
MMYVRLLYIHDCPSLGACADRDMLQVAHQQKCSLARLERPDSQVIPCKLLDAEAQRLRPRAGVGDAPLQPLQQRHVADALRCAPARGVGCLPAVAAGGFTASAPERLLTAYLSTREAAHVLFMSCCRH